MGESLLEWGNENFGVPREYDPVTEGTYDSVAAGNPGTPLSATDPKNTGIVVTRYSLEANNWPYVQIPQK